MAEYLYPGVYLEETTPGVTPIPGVSTSINDLAFESLASDFSRAMQTAVPQWTAGNESDPGVTLVEIFAFLSESLLDRANRIPERGRVSAHRAAVALDAIGHRGEPPCEGLTRPSFFFGRLLDAATLAAEQDYEREKLRRHNRALLGYGVVSGLAVRVEAAPDAAGWRVVVDPGYAIDPNGEEIALPSAVTLTPPSQGDSAFVTLRFWERPCSPVPTASGELAPSAIEEACVIGISSGFATPAIPLARLARSETGWQLDPEFRAPRVRS